MRPLPALRIIDVGDLAEREIPVRKWLVPNLIPSRQVTLLSGDGGTGKSLLALQLGLAVQTGTDWVGTMPAPGSALYLSAEDEVDECHRRLADICVAQGIEMADARGFGLIDLAEEDALLAVSNRFGGLELTALYVAVERAIEERRPSLVVIDTAADTFGGNENARTEVRHFVRSLKRLAMRFDLAIVLLSHPSLAGIASGTGLSGSTAWHGSVRSRLYFEHAGEDSDPDLRRLTTKKANFGPKEGEIRLRWERGRFVPLTTSTSFNRIAAEHDADEKFMELLAAFDAAGRHVSDKPSSSYAPKLFESEPRAGGIKSRGFEAAMRRLFEAKRIRVEQIGSQSRNVRRIVASG